MRQLAGHAAVGFLGKRNGFRCGEALKAVTISAAYQIFEETRKGSITPEKLADFVLLDQNPLLADPARIGEIQVQKTIKQGEVIYDREDSK